MGLHSSRRKTGLQASPGLSGLEVPQFGERTSGRIAHFIFGRSAPKPLQGAFDKEFVSARDNAARRASGLAVLKLVVLKQVSC
jgi:hypothetical protein